VFNGKMLLLVNLVIFWIWERKVSEEYLEPDPSKPKTPAILAAEKRCSDHPEVAILLEIDPNPSNQNAKKGGSDVPTINTSPIQTHLLHSK